MTHKSWFFPDIATSPEALTPPGKFKLFLNESISPANILTSAIGAAYSQARNNPEAYGQGWDAYGGRFGASLAKVLVAGGHDASAELYDPTSGKFAATGSLSVGRSSHTATLLATLPVPSWRESSADSDFR